jgi:putative thioredoxin
VPAPQVRKFFESLAPTRIDQLVAEAAKLKADGNAGAARMHLESALQQEPGHERATMALVALLMQDGEVERADELLERWEGDPRFARILATLNFRRAIEGANRQALESRLAANPDDAEAHYALGCLLAAAGEWEPALEHLLATVRLDRKVAEDGGRKRLLDAFALLGDAHPLTDEYRRRLMNVLF